jgi:hypothetical protein
MDKMEILRLAISAAKDGDHALKLAREMVAFVSGETAPANTTNAPNLLDQISSLPLHSPQKPPLGPVKGASRKYKHWTEEECQRAATMLDNNVRITEIARVLGRPKEGIQAAYRKGILPCKIYKPNPNLQRSGAISMLKRGHKITERTQNMILTAKRTGGAA